MFRRRLREVIPTQRTAFLHRPKALWKSGPVWYWGPFSAIFYCIINLNLHFDGDDILVAIEGSVSAGLCYQGFALAGRPFNEVLTYLKGFEGPEDAHRHQRPRSIVSHHPLEHPLALPLS